MPLRIDRVINMLSVKKANDAIQRYIEAGINCPEKRDFYFTFAEKALKIKKRIDKSSPTHMAYTDDGEPIFECILPKDLINGIG